MSIPEVDLILVTSWLCTGSQNVASWSGKCCHVMKIITVPAVASTLHACWTDLFLWKCNSANKPSFQNPTTLHRCKKCSDILKVTSGGRAEIANLKACHFSHFQFCVFTLKKSQWICRMRRECQQSVSLHFEIGCHWLITYHCQCGTICYLQLLDDSLKTLLFVFAL